MPRAHVLGPVSVKSAGAQVGKRASQGSHGAEAAWFTTRVPFRAPRVPARCFSPHQLPCLPTSQTTTYCVG